mmetsp:Transcript_8767/g.19452  ORF Transcript_8767/g.19452 Transcript_8767/m.19452 type:complete len:317 (-) Transcript_8767:47-997(-)|eukprot:CAMPEP_0194759536 /NCGR_PEP_ID=MMETSP0323_2-20130528/12578_1 /TAXON_ID=2866 ORGANISM="Crypthecodinium cohnii, Strain Seligo" /NCGR_SAMPLE_ID=MMETSP0323_2 /ASSEMBLY_ACC=CAM_ASM_000346 /LENGTH=316 /DNA_ID=CAMNT_0039680323 /DNA_START=72 /DNA_END=1022 /DNA_ORIENTATION=+
MNSALPPGWAEHLDPASGKPYFHNTSTGVTTWERPAGTPASALPPGWQEHIDPTSGKPYYHNAALNQTTWERPAGLPAMASAVSTVPAAAAGVLKTGTVKVWFDEKQFGFIAPIEGGDDIFVHKNALEDGQSLAIGSTVQYEAEWSAQRNKFAAKRCKGAVPGPSGATAVAASGQNLLGGDNTGTVKTWFDDKGYGFIVPTGGGNDVFVHRNALSDGQSLTQGSTVVFSVQWDDRKNKYAATKCTGATGGPGGGMGSFAKAPGGFADSRFSPYGSAPDATIADDALRQAALQAQQQLQMGGAAFVPAMQPTMGGVV